MDKQELDLILENDKEWRAFILRDLEKINEKVDKIDKELATFKIKVFSIAALISGGVGYSMDFLTNLFKGG